MHSAKGKAKNKDTGKNSIHEEVKIQTATADLKQEETAEAAADVKAAEDMEKSASSDTGAASENPEIAELQSELDALKEDLNEANDGKLRLAAEFDNFRKRSRQEKDELYSKSVADVCAMWLPVLDNLERAVKTMEGISHEESKMAADGITLVLKQAEEIMGKLNVKEIPALGETFDPSLHEAVMHYEDEEKGSQEITEVFLKGYSIGERVLRHSVVKVAN